MGGEKRKLGLAPASFMKIAFNILTKNAKDMDFDVTLEASHHGPYLRKMVI